MKTLANCAPVEFLRQTNKIRHSAGELLAKSGVLEIRKRQPSFTGEETEEERKEKITVQAKKNLDEMLDVLLESDPEGTVKLMGMLCFLEPEEALAANGLELFGAAMELLNSKAVIGFLSSLMRLAR